MTSPDDELPVEDFAAEPAEAEPFRIACWRCELAYEYQQSHCPHCRARNRDFALAPMPVIEPAGPIKAMLITYCILLFTSVIMAAVSWSLRKEMDADTELILDATFSGIDAVVVLAALGLCGPVSVLPRLRPGRVVQVWLLAIPAFAALLALNYCYFHAIRIYIGADWLLDEAMPRTPANVILMCVMPAIMEEVFFRYLALGSLWRTIGLHSAVLLSSAMFALAHLYNPLGMPYLFVCGCVLGYCRAFGGGLLLPMILHFLHNYAVLFTEAFA